MPQPKYNHSLFIFRRDYRLDDNLGLLEALNNSIKVIPIFILTPEQLDNRKNPYKSNNAVQFMIESLDDLDKQLKKKKSNGNLTYFYGTPHIVVGKILRGNKNIQAVYINADYSPYSIKRDRLIAKVCTGLKIDFHSIHDLLLQPAGSIKTKSGQIYSKFTPFFNASKVKKVEKPTKNNKTNYLSYSGNKSNNIVASKLNKFYKKNDQLWKKGGRTEALKILNNLKSFKSYNKKRNNLSYDTTYLSAYIKFGCISIREVYHAFKKVLGTKNDLIKQLYWRDFYHNILLDNPHVVGGAMKKKYNKLKWNNNKSHFDKWCQGLTGFPIVDAAMRSMNVTGFMHNRARLIVSNFLIKILNIDWRWGEKYFSQKLLDIDIANNNGNWQWGASTGADSQPYFRIFNPWIQSQKYDPNGNYIKKWIPELEIVKSKHLHQWDKYYTLPEYKTIKYPKPIIDYQKGKAITLKHYKAIF